MIPLPTFHHHGLKWDALCHDHHIHLERCEGLLRLPAGAAVPLPPLALPLRAAGSAQCLAADVATQRGMGIGDF